MKKLAAPSIDALLKLSHELGREDRGLAILGEGNTSIGIDAATFAVKASGCHLGALKETDITSCDRQALLLLLTKKNLPDSEIDAALMSSRIDSSAKKPSVEAIFHAWLLSLPEIQFIGHTHPVKVNGLLCSKWARMFARKRLFPDQIVCCGEESVFVGYSDPGLKLAQAIQRETEKFIQRTGQLPRLILLENHGLIALGKTVEAVLAATLMAEKAAGIFLHAASAAAPRFLNHAQVKRISGRPDEHHRRRTLGI